MLSGNQGEATAGNAAALGGGLGALSIILALGLVGVVTGWVWSCHNRSRRESPTLHEG